MFKISLIEEDLLQENKKLKKLLQKTKEETRRQLEITHRRELAKRKSILTELSLIPEEEMKNWTIIKEGNRVYLKYKKLIRATKILYNDREYKIPKEHDIFTINGLKIEINDKVVDTSVSYDYAFNPHADGMICIGNIRGSTLHEAIEKIPKIMETINLDSVMNEEVEEYIIRNITDKVIGKKIWEDRTYM